MQNKMLQNSICDSERSEIPKDFFGKLREDPCAADIRAALPRGLRGYPHSDALHPIYVFRNAFLTCFFKKFQKIFRQMRDKYHYKAYVAFRMRENCTECRSDNSGSPIQYLIWPRPVSGRSYPPLPQKAASVWMHALSLS